VEVEVGPGSKRSLGSDKWQSATLGVGDCDSDSVSGWLII